MLDLILAATLYAGPNTVAIHTDDPVYAGTVCERLVALDDTTICALLPSRGGPDTDVTLYLPPEMNGPLSCLLTADAIGGGRCDTRPASEAPTWLNEGTTHQPYTTGSQS